MDLNNIPTELPKSIDDAIGNLTRKPTQNIGTTFADCWYLVFGGLSLKADKKKLEYQASLETFREQLENKRNTIPPEKLVEPDIQTTCTALENSKYCIDKEELRNMFVTLISNSISSDTASKCHPSFGEIIKQMNVLDAKNIALFKNIKEYPIAEYRINFKNGGYTTLLRNVFLDGDNNYSLEQHASSISSLCRLGL